MSIAEHPTAADPEVSLSRFGILVPWLLFALLLCYFWRPIEDYDIWFYLVGGREMAATGKIPNTMFYLLPLLGEPANYIEWGFGLIYYWAYLVAGYVGMTALNAVFGAATLLIAYRAAVGRGTWLHPWALLALLLVAWSIEPRVNYRAETALLLAVAVVLWRLESYVESGNWRSLAAIPAVGWLLTLLHPSVFFLLLVLGAYVIEFWFVPPSGLKRGTAIKAMLLTGIVTAALACINPYGWHQVALPVLAVLSPENTLADISEYISVLQTEYAINFLVMAGLATLAIILQRRISSSLLLLLFGGLTYLYVRNIGLFALLLLVPLVRLASWRLPLPAPLRVQQAGAGLVLSMLLVLPLWQGKWGSGIKSSLFPENSATYLRQHLPGGHVLNFYEYGGYLAWVLGANFLVFVDGHDTRVNRAVELHDAIFRADPGWDDIVRQYKIDAIFTPTVMQYSGRMIPLLQQLVNNDDWRLVVREPSGLLFLRADHVKSGTTITIDKRQVWEQMIVEARRELERSSELADPWAALATAWRALGDRVQAAEAERRYLVAVQRNMEGQNR